MPAVLAATRLQSEQTEPEELDRRLEELETELKEKLLADAEDDEAVANFDLHCDNHFKYG